MEYLLIIKRLQKYRINCINLPVCEVVMGLMGLHDPMIDWALLLADLSLP